MRILSRVTTRLLRAMLCRSFREASLDAARGGIICRVAFSSSAAR